MNYYRRYIGDYQRDTPHLSLAEHGAYTVLLDAYYANGGHIPTDHDQLFRLCRAFEEYERTAVVRVSDHYFPVNGDGSRHNKRADKELLIASDAIEKMRESGRVGAKRRWGNDGEPYRAPHRVTYGVTYGVTIEPPTTNHQPPTTSNQPLSAEPLTTKKSKVKTITHPAGAFVRPDDCPEQAWNDWLKARKVKRLPNTATAWAGFLREVAKAGTTPALAIQTCAERGWAGFKADWEQQHARGGKINMVDEMEEFKKMVLRQSEKDITNG